MNASEFEHDPPALEPAEDCWFLTGATAAGKSSVGVLLANRWNAEIISLDSMAIYRGMDIGTAKPTLEQRAAAPHHLVDICEPTEDFSLSQYVQAAHQAAADIRGRGKQVLFVGGTPLYLKALLRGVYQGPPADWEFRREVEEEVRSVGLQALHQRLWQVDPVLAAKLHPSDKRRIIRALEVHKATGQPLSHRQVQFEEEHTAKNCRVFVISWPRPELHQRISERVEGMLRRGLLDELRGLLQALSAPRPHRLPSAGLPRVLAAPRGLDELGGDRAANQGPHPAIRSSPGDLVSRVERMRIHPRVQRRRREPSRRSGGAERGVVRRHLAGGGRTLLNQRPSPPPPAAPAGLVRLVPAGRCCSPTRVANALFRHRWACPSGRCCSPTRVANALFRHRWASSQRGAAPRQHASPTAPLFFAWTANRSARPFRIGIAPLELPLSRTQRQRPGSRAVRDVAPGMLRWERWRNDSVMRSHTCGQLRREDIGQEVVLCGWIDRPRDHGQTVFLDLRDRYGKTQVVAAPEGGEPLIELAEKLRSEDVVRVRGVVAARPEETANPKLATGEIEVRSTQIELLNKCQTPPFQPSAPELPSEDLRLRYRFLDLRREEMQRTLLLRHRLIQGMREYFDEHGFVDVETPILGRSTPEGARDYLVPSRVHQGSFYALPQSPQLYKQILMVAGYRPLCPSRAMFSG